MGWGSSGMREERKLLKKTQAVNMMEKLWRGTNTAVIGLGPSDAAAAASSSWLPLSAWKDRTQHVHKTVRSFTDCSTWSLFNREMKVH